MPPFNILPVEEADLLEVVHVRYEAYAPHLTVLWHRKPSEETFKQLASEMAESLNSKTGAMFKAVDVETGRMAGVSSWKVYETTPSVEELEESFEDRSFPEEYNAEARAAFMANILQARKDYAIQRPNVSLDSLTVSPDFQRRGVGRLLMQWGMDKADKLGLENYLEASQAGKKLYESCGFRAIKEMQFDMRPWGVERTAIHAVMFRQPVQAKSD
ncbi:acyl-CoA N-acyltransferase [Microthyrium microscopicum]|uniref:Acyl-CoA N-acyltransferase n=1 Tax=Microthyrium microscopicum TaxID=703497 RepID=A0A6A6URE1_9PEZI|nr:acyl-CoA N-acyltransferase [Microthyrium microscopicum]